MLNRLLKYDMKSYSRVLLPLYGAILAVAAANGLAWRVSDVTGGSVDSIYYSDVRGRHPDHAYGSAAVL